MAAEIKQMVEEYADTILRFIPEKGDLDSILIAQAELVFQVTRVYWAHLITKAEALKAVEKIYSVSMDAVLNVEKKRVSQIAKQAGIEILTTDTRGSKTTKALTETGIPWATGEPSTGIAVAVINPKIGIAGSHRNVITIENEIQYSMRILDDPMVVTQEPDPKVTNIVNPDSLVEVAERATREALEEFAAIAPGGLLPFDKTIIMVAGLDFLPKSQDSLVTDAVDATLRIHPALNNDITKGRARHIIRFNKLGKSEGIIYGGPTHPTFNEPRFYNLGFK